MAGRTSKVESLTIISIDQTSVLEIGDSRTVEAASYVLAVQREPAIYYQHEFPFAAYPLFSLPRPLPEPPEPFDITTCQEDNTIRVHRISASFLAASAVLQIGSNDRLTLDTRVKNIRHLLREKP